MYVCDEWVLLVSYRYSSAGCCGAIRCYTYTSIAMKKSSLLVSVVWYRCCMLQQLCTTTVVSLVAMLESYNTTYGVVPFSHNIIDIVAADSLLSPPSPLPVPVAAYSVAEERRPHATCTCAAAVAAISREEVASIDDDAEPTEGGSRSGDYNNNSIRQEESKGVRSRGCNDSMSLNTSEVGYQIRLASSADDHKTRLLFCTTGVLLRKLMEPGYLSGLSHLIIDEVHERQVL